MHGQLNKKSCFCVELQTEGQGAWNTKIRLQRKMICAWQVKSCVSTGMNSCGGRTTGPTEVLRGWIRGPWSAPHPKKYFCRRHKQTIFIFNRMFLGDGFAGPNDQILCQSLDSLRCRTKKCGLNQRSFRLIMSFTGAVKELCGEDGRNGSKSGGGDDPLDDPFFQLCLI